MKLPLYVHNDQNVLIIGFNQKKKIIIILLLLPVFLTNRYFLVSNTTVKVFSIYTEGANINTHLEKGFLRREPHV